MTAYLDLIAAYDHAFTDPAHIASSTFDQYLIGNGRTIFDISLSDEKKMGRYYRGTPAQQRVRVISINLKSEPKTVLLRSCPLANASDPWTEYSVATGKPVASGPPPKVRPPYAKNIKVAQLSGQWLIIDFSTDASKTCTP